MLGWKYLFYSEAVVETQDFASLRVCFVPKLMIKPFCNLATLQLYKTTVSTGEKNVIGSFSWETCA